MAEKILIIDDQGIEIMAVKNWLIKIGYNESDIIPNTNDDIQEMENISKLGRTDFCQYIEKQIRQHYKDLVLILCDIKFNDDPLRGNYIVKHIRQIKNLTPSNWATMVPIIGMTNFADSETSIDDLLIHGADYAFKKSVLKRKDHEKKKRILRSIIDTRIQMFINNVTSNYPSNLKDDIIKFKDKYSNKKTAFIMTSFRYKSFAKEVLKTLKQYDIKGFIADAPGGEFSGKIWDNMDIMMHGCDFGICIYSDDSIVKDETKTKRDKMNPNVNIEVGYMLGLQKKVCFLKHESISNLPTDFGNVNYVAFKDEESIRTSLKEWLINRGLIEKLSDTNDNNESI